MPDRDEHYDKYRVFYEPQNGDFDEDLIGHPVPFDSKFKRTDDDGNGFEIWEDASEVEGLFYVLRPENDRHARVAMAAYAYSCKSDYPTLAADLLFMLEEVEYQEDTGESSVSTSPKEETVGPLRLVMNDE